MRCLIQSAVVAVSLTGQVFAQDYLGPASGGGQETLFRYDDQEPWKHGYRKIMPYHEGFHSFRPYNYHHVFGQSKTAAAWGQSMPYSQQWWHRYHSPSSQYNHLQGQPPMAVPQYQVQPGPDQLPSPPPQLPMEGDVYEVPPPSQFPSTPVSGMSPVPAGRPNAPIRAVPVAGYR